MLRLKHRFKSTLVYLKYLYLQCLYWKVTRFGFIVLFIHSMYQTLYNCDQEFGYKNYWDSIFATGDWGLFSRGGWGMDIPTRQIAEYQPWLTSTVLRIVLSSKCLYIHTASIFSFLNKFKFWPIKSVKTHGTATGWGHWTLVPKVNYLRLCMHVCQGMQG